MALFFDAPVPDRDLSEAARFLSWFIAGGQEITDRPGPKLIDWQQDAAVIASDVNRVAGQEIRALADGTITDISEDLLWGSVITVDHGFGCYSRYCGAIPKDIAKGDRVKAEADLACRDAVVQYGDRAGNPHRKLNVPFFDWLAKNRYNRIYI